MPTFYVSLKTKIRVTQINQIIQSEMPYLQTNKLLDNIEVKNMVRRPCDYLNPLSLFVKNGKCTKKFHRT